MQSSVLTTPQTHKTRQISPLIFAAEMLAETNVPFAGNFCGILKKDMTPEELQKLRKRPIDPLMCVAAEATSHMIIREILRTGIKNILFPGCKLSTICIHMALAGSISRAVELDVPETMQKKRSIIDRLQKEKIVGSLIHRLIMREGDPTSLLEISRACSRLDESQNVASISLNFLTPYPLDEKERIVKNHREVLNDYKGVFITSDLDSLEFICCRPGGIDAYRKHMYAQTGIDVIPNTFKTMHDARGFFQDLGFKIIGDYSLSEMAPQCKSIARLGLNKNETSNLLVNRPLWVMSAN